MALSAPIIVAAGAIYDGGNKRFDRGSGACEDGEGGDADAVFVLQGLSYSSVDPL